jgi:hypothetical protein
VASYGIQPGHERLWVLQRADLSDDLDPDVLERILNVVAHGVQTPDIVAKSRLEPPEQLLKCRLFAVLTTANQAF